MTYKNLDFFLIIWNSYGVTITTQHIGAPLMQEKRKKTGPKFLSPYTQEIENSIKNIYLQLSEKDRRKYAAIEALKLPRGGIAYIGQTSWL